MNCYIITGQSCNAKCGFCIGRIHKCLEKTIDDKTYFSNLEKVLSRRDITSITILGGEPTVSPRLKRIIQTMKDFTQLKVMTTNGKLLNSFIPDINLSNFDHINISRHHYLAKINNRIFCQTMQSNKELKESIKRLNPKVRINTVLQKHFINNSNLYNMLDFINGCGASDSLLSELSLLDASYISIENVIKYCDQQRILLKDLDTSKMSFLFEESSDYFIDRIFKYKNINVRMRSSNSVLKEKLLSEDSNKIFDLKFHPNGILSKSWNPTKLILPI